MQVRRVVSRRRFPVPPPSGSQTADIQDLLSTVSERTDLERLFDRKVALSQILRLAGRRVDRDRIVELLDSADPTGDLKKLLDS